MRFPETSTRSIWAALVRWASGRRIDLALGHGSNDVSVAAALLRIPSVTAFDYEYARVQHSINCRLARRVVVPEAIPPARLAPYGAGPEELLVLLLGHVDRLALGRHAAGGGRALGLGFGLMLT